MSMSLESAQQPVAARGDDEGSLGSFVVDLDNDDIAALNMTFGQAPDGEDPLPAQEPLVFEPLDHGAPCGGYQEDSLLDALGADLPLSGLEDGSPNIEEAPDKAPLFGGREEDGYREDIILEAPSAAPLQAPGSASLFGGREEDGYQEDIILEAPSAAPLQAPGSASLFGGHELGYQEAHIEQAPEGTLGTATSIGVETSLDVDSRVYYCYGEFAHVLIKLWGLPRELRRVAVFAHGDCKRGSEIASEQSLHWTKNGQTFFFMDDASDAVIFKVPTAATRKACAVHGRSNELYIDLVLDRTQTKLFNSKDCAAHPGRDNTFRLLVACTFADGTSQTIEIQPRMRVLSKQSNNKRKQNLPEEVTRPYKAFRTTFENSRTSSE